MGVGEEGIFISASIRTLLIVFGDEEPGSSSLLAQSVQLNVSPTYADPKAGGSVSSGERMKESLLIDGYARDAAGAGKVDGEDRGVGAGVGRGCWMEREGRERLRGHGISISPADWMRLATGEL